MPDRIHVSSELVDIEVVRLGPRVGPPVLLLPGLGANHRAYELRPEQSFAEYMTERERTPWALDFTVSWRREKQDAAALLHALEMALAELRRIEETELDDVDAVGHSLGGLLLLALLVDGVPLRRVVLMATGLDYRVGATRLRRLLGQATKLRPLAETRRPLPGVPLRKLAALGANLTGRGMLPFEGDQFHTGTTDPLTVQRFFREGVRDMTLPLLLDLAALYSEGGLSLGASELPLKEAVSGIEQPVLFVAARQDKVCVLGSVRDAAERIPGSQLLEVGAGAAGGAGYGHLDLLTATAARRDVFEPVGRFLDA